MPTSTKRTIDSLEDLRFNLRPDNLQPIDFIDNGNLRESGFKSRKKTNDKETIKLCSISAKRPVEIKRMSQKNVKASHSGIKQKSLMAKDSQGHLAKIRRLSNKLDENVSTEPKRLSTRPVESEEMNYLDKLYTNYKEYIAKKQDSKSSKYVKVRVDEIKGIEDEHLNTEATVLAAHGYKTIEKNGKLTRVILIYIA